MRGRVESEIYAWLQTFEMLRRAGLGKPISGCFPHGANNILILLKMFDLCYP